jgi:DivIVA domain-containing protein
MDATPKLITDVKFDTRKRGGGYEPEQVDGFLSQLADRVAQLQDMLRRTTSQVEEAEARAAEAKRAQAAAQAEIEKLRAEVVQAQDSASVREHGAEAEAEHASRVLLMAQKTADATIEDANRTAQQTIGDARTKAAGLLAEAETDAGRLRSEAQRETEDLIAQRRDTVLSEVRDLEGLRDQVSHDVDVLQRFLDEHRARVRSGIASLQQVLDDPATFRDHPTPETSGATSDSFDAGTAPGSVAGPHSAPAADDDEPVVEDAVVAETDQPEGVGSLDEPVDEALDVPMGAVESVEPSTADDVIIDVTEPEDAPFGEGPQAAATLGADEQADEFPAVPVPEFLRDEADEAPLDIGPPTELFSPFVEPENGPDPLGKPDDEADAAMRAFFDADFDEDDDAAKHKSRFGFRR